MIDKLILLYFDLGLIILYLFAGAIILLIIQAISYNILGFNFIKFIIEETKKIFRKIEKYFE